LKFLSGGGGDKSRAGFTSRVVVVTETDGMDQPGVMSRDADKIMQLEARTRAYGSRKRIYLQCTVSTEERRTWREYVGGTRSRIALCCPHCHEWVSPEREHLTGWQEAQSQTEARADDDLPARRPRATRVGDASGSGQRRATGRRQEPKRR
jgi:phage terminase large subunit GpA-like protein